MTNRPLIVDVVQAWPRQHQSRTVRLPPGSTVGQALAEAGLETAGHVGVAIHGEAVGMERVLRTGDRVELLRPLVADPKDARRRRAGG